MAFRGLTITKDGLAIMAQAHLGTGLIISKVKIGDGSTTKDFIDLHDLIHALYAKDPVMHRNENQVFLDLDISSNDGTGYYFREIGIYAKDTLNNEVLYAYDSAGEDAEYIAPVDSGITYEKRLRFCFIVDTAINVTISTSGTIYALQEDLEGLQQFLTNHETNKSNPHEVTKAQVGLSNVTNETQVKRTEMGVANGVATLDADGTLPTSQIPTALTDGTIKVKKAEVADSAPWSGVSGKPSSFPPSTHTHNYQTLNNIPASFPPSTHTHDDRYYTGAEITAIIAKYTPLTSGFGGDQAHLTANALSVANNVITHGTSNQTTNMPPGVVVAILHKYKLNGDHFVVVAYETIPNKGNVWINTCFVNGGGWSGWKLMVGKVDLWSGNATPNANIPISMAKSFFRSIDVYFSLEERLNIPTTDGNEVHWGSLITTSGAEFYLKSFKLTFMSNTIVKLNSAIQKNINTGSIENVKIIKLVGRP